MRPALGPSGVSVNGQLSPDETAEGAASEKGVRLLSLELFREAGLTSHVWIKT